MGLTSVTDMIGKIELVLLVNFLNLMVAKRNLPLHEHTMDGLILNQSSPTLSYLLFIFWFPGAKTQNLKSLIGGELLLSSL